MVNLQKCGSQMGALDSFFLSLLSSLCVCGASFTLFYTLFEGADEPPCTSML